MGVDLVYAIEVKSRRNNGQWDLVKLIVPIEKYGYSSDYNNDAMNLELDGKQFHCVYDDAIRGIVRDLLSENSWYDTIIPSRGFPEDLSDELKEKYTPEALQGSWGASYCTLEELRSSYDKLLRTALRQYLQRHVDERFEYINARFDRLEHFLVNNNKLVPLKSFETKNEFDPDNDDDINQSLWDALWFGQWMHGIKAIAEFFTGIWLDDDAVRIVYFFG